MRKLTIALCGCCLAIVGMSPVYAAGVAHDVNMVAVQRALKDKGYRPGAADGVIGPRTRAALREFQKAAGLEVTGRLDRSTLAELGLAGTASNAPSSVPDAAALPREGAERPRPGPGLSTKTPDADMARDVKATRPK